MAEIEEKEEAGKKDEDQGIRKEEERRGLLVWPKSHQSLAC